MLMLNFQKEKGIATEIVIITFDLDNADDNFQDKKLKKKYLLLTLRMLMMISRMRRVKLNTITLA